MRIGESMAHNGSGNFNDQGQGGVLRPESPTFIIEEQIISDIEIEDGSENVLLRPLRPPASLNFAPSSLPSGNVLQLPSSGADEGLTDTEDVMSENDEDEDDSPTSPLCSQNCPARDEHTDAYERAIRDLQDEGEVTVRDACGQLIVISRQTKENLNLPGKSTLNLKEALEDALTDMEDIEGEYDPEEDDDEEDHEDPIDDPAFQARYFEGDRSTVTVIEKEKLPEKRYSLTEFLIVNKEEDALTDVEDLDESEGFPDLLKVINQPIRRLITPELAVDPMTDEEEPIFEDGEIAGTSKGCLYADGRPRRSITPSDCGDGPLYENITDEEDMEPPPKQLCSNSSGLGVPKVDDGALTDYEDFSGEEDDFKKPLNFGQDETYVKWILDNIEGGGQTSVALKEREAQDIEEIEIKDQENDVRCEILEAKQLSERVVYYKAQFSVDSDEEGDAQLEMKGEIQNQNQMRHIHEEEEDDVLTDVEEMPDIDPRVVNPRMNKLQRQETLRAEDKALENLLDSSSSQVTLKEGEIEDMKHPPTSKTSKQPKVCDTLQVNHDDHADPLTDLEDVDESKPCVEIVISPGSPVAGSGSNAGTPTGSGSAISSNKRKARKRQVRKSASARGSQAQQN